MFPGYFFRRLLAVCFCLSIFILQSALAQGSGTVKGKVFDKTTKDALPGANVTIKGTSIGAAANLDGMYVIRNAPAGQRTVVVSYLGYVSTSVVLDIPEGGTVTRDFSLAGTAIEGEEILVTAQAKGQMQAINQQLASNKIANVVSEAKIQELPDFNAAQAISRLPGVSTLQSSGEANKVVIRGLAPQYNAVAVAGITLASTGSTQAGISSNPDIPFTATNQDRSVDLTMVTPYMIKSISVYKSLTPDLDANAIGGRVEMDLREAPSGYHADVLWQSGYVGKSREYGNYRFVASGSNRFFNDALGLYVLGNVEQYDRSSDNMSAQYSPRSHNVDSTGYAPVFVTNVQLNRHLETRQRYGGNIILDYTLPFGVLRSTNLFSRLSSDYQEYQQRLLYQDHNVQYRYQAGNKKTDVAMNTLEADLDFNFLSMNLKAASNYSRNYEPHSAFVIFNETGAIPGTFPDNTRPEDLAHFVTHRGPQNVYLWSINLFNLDFKENDQVYKSDFKIPFSVGSDFSGSFKFGGEYRYNHRVNNQNLPYARMERGQGTGGSAIQRAIMDSLTARYGLVLNTSVSRFPGTNFTYPTEEDLRGPFLEDRFGPLVWIPRTETLVSMVDYVANEPSFNSINSSASNAGGWFDGAYEHLANYYKYIEKYYAGYLMTDLSLGSDITLVGGARYEQDNSLFEAYNMKDGRNAGTQIPYPVTVYPQNHYWLPMVQGKYNVTDWVDVRYSYTQTLARPDYTQLTPHFTMDFSRGQVWAGNPKLMPGRAYNHDVQFTFHSNDLGLLSIGAFYKTIKNFTYYTQYKLHLFPLPGRDSIGTYTVGGVSPTDGATLNTYINSPYEATVKGVEADFQTRFWYLPIPFNGVVLGINYTHIWSKATYPFRDDVPVFIPPRTSYTVYLDSTRTGRLINQPDDILNAYLGYDYEGFSGRVSCVFQGNSVSSIGIFPEQDSFTRDYFRLDLSARQKLPWAGFQVFLDVTNLNSRRNESAQRSLGGFTSVQNYGVAANLGIRFTL